MKVCPLCQSTKGFRVSMGESGLRHVCLACTGVIPARDEDDEAQAAAPAITAKPSRGHAAMPTPASDGPINVLSLARARLKAVNAELKRMKSLEVERGQLQRIIEAATQERAARRHQSQTLDGAVARLVPKRTAHGN